MKIFDTTFLICSKIRCRSVENARRLSPWYQMIFGKRGAAVQFFIRAKIHFHQIITTIERLTVAAPLAAAAGPFARSAIARHLILLNSSP